MIDRAIETQIDIAVAPERVWRAWTEGAEFVAWWGEDGIYKVTSWTGDVRPGGKWRSEGEDKDGKPFNVQGEYLRVEPPHILSFTWQPDWLGPDSHTTVFLEFQRTDNGTRLMLRHSGFGTNEARDSHSAGWNRVLGWLHGYLSLDN